MSQLDELLSINKMLVEDQPQYRRDSGSFPKDVVNQRKLMRSLMNVRYPRMIPQKLLEAQDVYLSKELKPGDVLLLKDGVYPKNLNLRNLHKTEEAQELRRIF